MPNGTGKSFNHTTAYPASDFCNTSGGDCTITLYANWKASTYTISYDSNGGSLPSSGVQNLTRSISTTDTGDKTFYAEWCQNCATVANESCSLTANEGSCSYTTSYNTGYNLTNCNL